MPKGLRKPMEEMLLGTEGGKGGVGGGGSGVGGTRWSSMPSFRSNASTMDDLRKLTKDTSHLKGGAKAAADEAKTRAAKRTGVRAAGATAAVEGAKAALGTSEAKSKPQQDTDEEIFQEVQRVMRKVDEDIEAEKYAKPDKYKQGGSVSASRRADGCAQRGKTRGKVV
jgi:hypothetical protein